MAAGAWSESLAVRALDAVASRSTSSDRVIMAQSPTGVIPEDLMRPQALQSVMTLLVNLPIPGDDKEELLLGWAHAVGVKLNSAQRATVRDSGIDRQ